MNDKDALELFTDAGLPARALEEPDFPISLEQELIICMALVRRLGMIARQCGFFSEHAPDGH